MYSRSWRKGEASVPDKSLRVMQFNILADGLSGLRPDKGLFDRVVNAGQNVVAGQTAGWFHYIMEPDRPSFELKFKHDGFILAHTNRGIVEKGEMLALVANDVLSDA